MPTGIQFVAAVDFTLVMATLMGFLIYINVWARGNSADTSVDLVVLLPRARIRVVCFFIITALFCWMVNIAVWAIFLLLLVLGVTVSFVSGVEGTGGALGFAGFLVREWAFGFPELRLHPIAEPDSHVTEELSRLIGRKGTTVSSLRPYGEAEFDGVLLTVVSENGKLMQRGVKVVATGERNGKISVMPIDAPSCTR